MVHADFHPHCPVPFFYCPTRHGCASLPLFLVLWYNVCVCVCVFLNYSCNYQLLTGLFILFIYFLLCVYIHVITLIVCCCQESSRPYTSQEIKVELLSRSNTAAPSSPAPPQLTPHQPSPSIILSPFTRRHPSPSGGGSSFSHLKVHPSSSHPFPSSGHGTMGGTPHPLPSPLSTSHRPTNTSFSKETTELSHTDDGDLAILKLDGVPTSRRGKNGDNPVSVIEMASRSSSSSGVTTPTREVTFVTDSSASPEDVAKKTTKSLGKGGRSKRSYSNLTGKKATTGGIPRRTSKSAFKVGTRLSLRTSPRKSIWEEQFSSISKSAKVSYI